MTPPARRLIVALQLAAALAIVGFSTWQLFLGNFEAAFSSLPLLLCWYLFLAYRK